MGLAADQLPRLGTEKNGPTGELAQAIRIPSLLWSSVVVRAPPPAKIATESRLIDLAFAVPPAIDAAGGKGEWVGAPESLEPQLVNRTERVKKEVWRLGRCAHLEITTLLRKDVGQTSGLPVENLCSLLNGRPEDAPPADRRSAPRCWRYAGGTPGESPVCTRGGRITSCRLSACDQNSVLNRAGLAL